MHRMTRGISIVLTIAAVALFSLAANSWAAPAFVTQMFDNGHTSSNPNETQLTVAKVKSSFGPLFKRSLDAQVYSQPLYLPNLNMGTLGTHNALFIATENNTIYAFDADTNGPPLWTRNLTPAGETVQVATDYNNTRVPQVGITGTPVIDLASGTIYAVAASKTISSPVVFHQRLNALNVVNGAARAGSPVDIHAKYHGTGGIQDGQGNVVFDPLAEFNRPALLLFNGLVYTGWGSHEDNGNYQGWVIAYNKTTLQQAGVFNTSPSNPPGTGGGSIWQASIGLVADSDSVYFISGNGPFDVNTGGPNYGDSAVRLGTSFQVLDYFTPCNQQELNSLDVDLGSGGMMILPDQTAAHVKIATHAGKEGSIYVLDRTNMGKYRASTVADNVPCTDNVVQKLWRVLGASPTNGTASRNAFWGAPAYYRDASGHQTVYYSGADTAIKADSLASDTLTGTSQTPDTYPSGGTIPAISSNGGLVGTAVMWAIKRANSTDGNGPLTLDAYDATNLATRLVVDIPAGPWNKRNFAFLIPTVVNGKVYIASDGELDVFGLTGGTPTPTPTSSKTPTATPTSAKTPTATPTSTAVAGNVQITAPANGATVSGTVSIAAQVSSSVSWINIYIDGHYLASGPPFTFSWNSTTVANGAHTISAKSYATGGAQNGTASVSVTVSNSGGPAATPTSTPASSTVKITAPANGATVSGTVTVTAQVASNVVWINIYIDGGYFASGPPYTFSWNSKNVANGTHAISTKAYASGGAQLGSDSISMKVAN